MNTYKTCISRLMYGQSKNERYRRTINAEHFKQFVSLAGITVRLTIWDTPGFKEIRPII